MGLKSKFKALNLVDMFHPAIAMQPPSHYGI